MALKQNNRRSITLNSGILILFGMISLAIFIWYQNADSMGDMDEIPIESYLDSPLNFVGNRYRLTGQIDDLIKGDMKVGRIFSVIPQNYSIRIPVFIPESLSANLQARQRFQMGLTVKENGLLWIDDLKKY